MKRSRNLTVALLALLFVYLGSYLVLSRQGYEEAKQYDMEGFYYFTPQDTAFWRLLNGTSRFLFTPVNALDRWLGLGHYPASDPLFSISN